MYKRQRIHTAFVDDDSAVSVDGYTTAVAGGRGFGAYVSVDDTELEEQLRLREENTGWKCRECWESLREVRCVLGLFSWVRASPRLCVLGVRLCVFCVCASARARVCMCVCRYVTSVQNRALSVEDTNLEEQCRRREENRECKCRESWESLRGLRCVCVCVC